ncbi:response regulator [Paenibacillus ihuae]|uniref:response regulator n=1 Tax=Paenibacillus ihuae TaxID=1232431 RepID=UPI0006D54AE6|nr:response regulator [Paenibacillus ihuae]
MIQALLVDDERLALMKLQLMLEELGTVTVTGAFTDPGEALGAAPGLDPDVIFLDIEMPEINGMQAAELMQNLCPGASIVFVTAYNDYAVDAFELNALDYVLKPVRRDRLQKTLRRLESAKAQVTLGNPSKLMLRCMQSIRFELDGQPLQSIRWRTLKAQEVFAYLLHNRNRLISKDYLIEWLWPELDVKKASTLLYTTIYQVRQCLKQAGIELQINSANEGYVLETGGLLIDTVEWEKGILALSEINEKNYTEHVQLLDSYSGDYLGDYGYIWAESERQRLRAIWLHQATGLAEFFVSSGKLPAAVTTYQRIVLLQPYFEQAHLDLMKVYDSMGDRIAVEQQYNTLCNLLNRELNIELPSHIIDWYENWKHINLSI